MKSVLFRDYGGPEVLEIVDGPVPEPGPGEICVRAEAIGVGVPDMLMRSGNYAWIPPLPVVPGNELAGTVAAVGSGVDASEVGQRGLCERARPFSARWLLCRIHARAGIIGVRPAGFPERRTCGCAGQLPACLAVAEHCCHAKGGRGRAGARCGRGAWEVRSCKWRAPKICGSVVWPDRRTKQAMLPVSVRRPL